MRLLPFLLAVLLSVAGTMSKANNIQIANSALTGDAGTTIQVQFDLSWENSWRLGSGRWDAAWVFVKYRTSLNGPWFHANLNNIIGEPRAIIASGGREDDIPQFRADAQFQRAVRSAHIGVLDNACQFECLVSIPAPAVMGVGGKRKPEESGQACTGDPCFMPFHMHTSIVVATRVRMRVATKGCNRKARGGGRRPSRC